MLIFTLSNAEKDLRPAIDYIYGQALAVKCPRRATVILVDSTTLTGDTFVYKAGGTIISKGNIAHSDDDKHMMCSVSYMYSVQGYEMPFLANKFHDISKSPS